jgi:hypothetical protein
MCGSLNDVTEGDGIIDRDDPNRAIEQGEG